MIEKITQSPYVTTLQQALHAAETRHKVTSDNIANVNTPGFKKSAVEFESLLAEQLAPKTKKLQLIRTSEKHYPMPESEKTIRPEIHKIDTTTMRTDGNNVDIDEEMSMLSKNYIYYNAAARQIGNYFSGLKGVIAGQK